MIIKFDKRENYIYFLNKLFSIAYSIKIGDYSNEDGEREKFSRMIQQKAIESKYVRNFPMGHTGKIHILEVNKEIEKIFLNYNSFLEVGYDIEEEEGVDILFLDNKGRDVFSVIAHEKMCIIDERYKKVLST